MRLAIRRRSVSNWVSPGPRKPMPPFCRSRWVQPLTSRLARCESCASSTCSLPSKLRARCAKISKNQAVRSNTRRPVSFSRLRSWLGVRVWSNQNDIRVVFLCTGAYFLGLARSDEVLRIRTRARSKHQADSNVPADAAKAEKFSRVIGIYRVPDTHAYQNSALTTSRAFKQLQRAARSLGFVTTSHRPGRRDRCHSTIAGSVTSPSSPVGNRTLRAGTGRWKWHVCRPSDSRYF